MTTAGIFRALAFVNCRGVSRNQRVEFSETIGDGAAVETGDQLTSVGVDIVDVTDVAIVDLFIVIVLDLHDLVAGREGPAEAPHFSLAGGIERRLQFDVERARADAAPVHRAQHLDVSNGLEPEALGDARFHQFDDPRHGRFWIVGLNEEKIVIAFGLGEIGNGALVDPVRAGDDPALGGLAEHLGQSNHRHRTGGYDVGEDLAWADGGKLVDVADNSTASGTSSSVGKPQ